MSEAELRDFQERWLIIHGQWQELGIALGNLAHAITEALAPIFEEIKRVALPFADMTRRMYLYQLLPRWIPGDACLWLALHWPKALLPKFSTAIEWMKVGAAR